MIRSVCRFLSAICCVACVMATVFVASFAPAIALPEIDTGATTVSTSPAVNVKYIHGSIKNLWGIDIPYSPELKSDRYAVNMRYLLGMVDIANARLGAVKTSYGTGEYATAGAVSKNTADKAIRTLIQKPIEFPFVATTTATTTTFSFSISAKGTFYVDWGDGGDVDKYVKTNTGAQTISHTYTTAGAYTVRLGGRATGYTTTLTGAITFNSTKNLAGIGGSLGEIFPTLADGGQPKFFVTFSSCTNLTGSIPENLFAGISGAPASSMFYSTFSGCSGLTGSIPEKLFAGISGAPVSDMFNSTFRDCRGLTGSIPENLFAGISGAPASSMFYSTFSGCSGLTGTIPENLFAGISGAPAGSMFYSTFSGCSGLTGTIPENLFAGISGAPAGSMFYSTFSGCSGLTGSIPEKLFAGISGAPAGNMFSGTFSGCSGLTGSIPENLFAGISGAPASRMFENTFSVCGGLTGSIPEKLFSGISGKPTIGMFSSTFNGCKGLTGAIPSGLFSNISGAPANSMFSSTFSGCSGLTGSIPEKLFAGISGAPDSEMFSSTFSGCSGLTGSIPEKLFGNIYGAPANYMFNGTFRNCRGLTGVIPSGLFGNLSGAPASYGMFNSTFYGCSGLTGEIPVGLFGNLSGSPTNNMFSSTFYNCSGLTGNSAQNPDGTPLYDVFPTATSNHVSGMYTGTCFDDNDSIPDAWGKNANCVPPEPEYPFTATVEITSSKTYSLDISAAGTFYVNWGDGSKYEKIVKTDTTTQHISHTYSANGTYTVKLGGLATAYSNGGGAIGEIAGYSKMDNGINVTEITGSLGKIFPTLADGSQPGFNRTFMYGQMKTIPAELFDGIHGAPIEEMFKHTFAACTSLTEVPAGLFSGIAGAPAKNMFWGTFASDSALTKLPDGLFAGISGTPAEYMFWATFEDCSGLTGSIPSGLFGNISGAPAAGMFLDTFSGCTGLTGKIPLGLFGNLSGSPASNMLSRTFYNCSGLTGASARNPDGTPLYDVFPTATSDQVGNMYTGTCLSDNASIPTAWGHNANCTYTEPEPAAVFTVTTVPNTSEFAFAISALGSFTVDWGDGQTTKIERTNSNKNGEIIKHTYTTAGEYTIGFSGLATAYPDRTFGNDFGSTSFAFGDSHINSTCNVASASGSLGKIFPTLADGSSPRFSDLFNQCANFTEIPETLFDGITTFGNYEFYQAFAGTGITRIPAKLFAGMSGAGNYNTFMATFADTAITEIPENLFATVSALGEESTFAYTFTGTKIKTIPAGLFASITGDARRTAFLGTFQNCKNLTEIPAGLFDGLNLTNLDMAADYGVFTETFAGCSSLTGPSAQTASGEYLYDVWSANYVEELANGMYAGDEGLDDYDTMPDYLKEASE